MRSNFRIAFCQRTSFEADLKKSLFPAELARTELLAGSVSLADEFEGTILFAEWLIVSVLLAGSVSLASEFDGIVLLAEGLVGSVLLAGSVVRSVLLAGSISLAGEFEDRASLVGDPAAGSESSSGTSTSRSPAETEADSPRV